MRILMLPFLAFCFSCSNNQHCNPGTPQKLLTIRLDNNGSISYQHEVLLEGLSKNCDSTTVMTAIKNYMENNASDTPISSVAVYNSAEHFDSGETLSQPKEFYGDCVVSVWFDATSGKPREFDFYNYKGNRDYEGVRWKR